MTAPEWQGRGELVQAARRELGLSKRELAELAGVDRATLRELEAGREPRTSTLAACSVVLPGLSPADLLPAGVGRVPPAGDEAWRHQRHVRSLAARRLTHRVHFGEVEEDELAGLTGELRDEAGLLRTMRSACLGKSRVLAGLRVPEPGGRTVVTDEPERHEFRRGGGRHGARLTYSRSRPHRPAGEPPERCESFEDLLGFGACAVVHHPLDELRLELELPDARPRRPRLLAWPAPQTPSAGDDLAPSLHPEGRGLKLRVVRNRLTAVVERPLVGLRYALGWTDEPRGRRRAAPRGAHEELQRARRLEGLSLRALAERMGVSAMTVKGAEDGRDLRAGTLEKAVAALPALSPWALLGELDPAVVPQRARAWSYWRDLYGCEVEEELKRVEVASSGNSRILLETTGLRRLRHPERDLVVRLGLARSVLQPTRASLDEVDSTGEQDEALLRIRRITEPGGEPQHQLVVPAESAARGVSFVRRLVHDGVYTMTDEAARERTGAEGPFREGTTFGATVPARRLRLIVHFPRGYWPSDFRVHAWALTDVPSSEAAGLAARLHPEGLAFETDRRRRTVSLEVEHALPGFKYALGWQLP
jgi:transcriptional regulator with XRE-family HTH domain